MTRHDGLIRLLAHVRERGAEEGRLDAAERARRPLVRRTSLPEQATDSPRAAAWARAIAEMDGYGFGGTDDDDE